TEFDGGTGASGLGGSQSLATSLPANRHSQPWRGAFAAYGWPPRHSDTAVSSDDAATLAGTALPGMRLGLVVCRSGPTGSGDATATGSLSAAALNDNWLLIGRRKQRRGHTGF